MARTKTKKFIIFPGCKARTALPTIIAKDTVITILVFDPVDVILLFVRIEFPFTKKKTTTQNSAKPN